MKQFKKSSLNVEVSSRKVNFTYDEYVEFIITRYSCSREEAEERIAREEAAASAAETSIF